MHPLDSPEAQDLLHRLDRRLDDFGLRVKLADFYDAAGVHWHRHAAAVRWTVDHHKRPYGGIWYRDDRHHADLPSEIPSVVWHFLPGRDNRGSKNVGTVAKAERKMHEALVAAWDVGWDDTAEGAEWGRLLAGVVDSPADEVARLIAADWCEEHGRDGRARCLRWMAGHNRWAEPGRSGFSWHVPSDEDAPSVLPMEVINRLTGFVACHAGCMEWPTAIAAEVAFHDAFINAVAGGWVPPEATG
jgi:uncharacterized protein (TIGR02996 family)